MSKRSASHPEEDDGLTGLRGNRDHPLHVGQHIGAIVMRRQLAHPRVEDIEHVGAGFGLRQQELAGHGRQLGHQLVPERGLAEHEDARVFVIAALAALDRIAGEGEGRAGKADQRHAAGIELRAHQLDGVEGEVHRFARIGSAQRGDIGRGAHRIVDDRPFAFEKGELQTHTFAAAAGCRRR